MEHKTYLKFLSQIAMDSSGHVVEGEVQIFFWWNACRGKMTFSSTLSESNKDLFQGVSGSKKLNMGPDRPYFEIRQDEVYLSQDIQGIPTYVEFRNLVREFIEMFQEFNDQSIGALPHPFR